MHAPTLHGKGPVWTQSGSAQLALHSTCHQCWGNVGVEGAFPPRVKAHFFSPVPFTLQLQFTHLCSATLPSRFPPEDEMGQRQGPQGSPRSEGYRSPEPGQVQHRGQQPALPGSGHGLGTARGDLSQGWHLPSCANPAVPAVWMG